MASGYQQTASGGAPTSGPATAQQPNTQAAPSVPSDDPGPIVKFKRLVPSLKQSLSTLMKIAGQILQQNAVKDAANPLKSQEIQANQQRLEKGLEDFYSICDQVEMNLRLALEMRKQTSDSSKNTPTPVTHVKTDFQQPQPNDSHTYPQYMNVVRAQINCAKDVHDVLLKFSQQIVDK